MNISVYKASACHYCRYNKYHYQRITGISGQRGATLVNLVLDIMSRCQALTDIILLTSSGCNNKLHPIPAREIDNANLNS